MPTKRVHSPEFKLRVAIQGHLASHSKSDTSNPWYSDLTTADVARKNDVNATLVRNWTKQLKQNAVSIFASDKKPVAGKRFHAPEFKVEVALIALLVSRDPRKKGDPGRITLARIGEFYDVHTTLVSNWRNKLEAQALIAFA